MTDVATEALSDRDPGDETDELASGIVLPPSDPDELLVDLTVWLEGAKDIAERLRELGMVSGTVDGLRELSIIVTKVEEAELWLTKIGKGVNQ